MLASLWLRWLQEPNRRSVKVSWNGRQAVQMLKIRLHQKILRMFPARRCLQQQMQMHKLPKHHRRVPKIPLIYIRVNFNLAYNLRYNLQSLILKRIHENTQNQKPFKFLKINRIWVHPMMLSYHRKVLG